MKINLRKEEISSLRAIAANYDCFRADKPSLPKLLRLIASGQLEIKYPLPVEVISRQLPPNLIQLRIQVEANINGILLKISEIIAKHKGDIYFAKASEDSNIIFISLNLPSSKNLVKLAEEIKKVNFINTFQFNSRKQKEKLLLYLASNDYERYLKTKETIEIGKESKLNKEKLLDDQLKYYIRKVKKILLLMLVILFLYA